MGIQAIGDIVNETSLKRNNNDNVGRCKTQSEIERADRLADYACEKMVVTEQGSFTAKRLMIYLMLSIIDCVETDINKGRNPAKYLS